jgi:ABC-2 type transport system ATP-binding protein
VTGPARRGATIEVRGLTKRFGPVLAVSGLDFTVEPGRVTGFLGPNGAGKTTTLRMLLGLVRPTAGTATIDGRRYRDLDHPIRHVGAVLEATSFHPSRRARSHLRMLALAGGIDRRRVDEVLELVGLSGDAKRKVRGFSMGMRQRLELAGALLGDPGVLILDEPSNGLDPQGIAWLREFLHHLASEGRTVLVSSHLLAEMAQTVDDVVIVSQGVAQAQGSLEQLMTQAQAGMKVTTPEADRLTQVLAPTSWTVRRVGPDMVLVDGATPEALGPVLAHHQVVVYEMVREGSNLEALFFSLTTGLGFAEPGGAPSDPAGPGSVPPGPPPPGTPSPPPPPPAGGAP